MRGSLAPVDRNTKECAGMRLHVTPAIADELVEEEDDKDLLVLPSRRLEALTFGKALKTAILNVGDDEQQIAKRIHMSQSYMSKFMNGVAERWARRFVSFMVETRCLAPLQWMAHQMDCDIVPRSARAVELAQLRRRIQELTNRTA